MKMFFRRKAWVVIVGTAVALLAGAIVAFKKLFFISSHALPSGGCLQTNIVEKSKSYFLGFDLDSFDVCSSQVKRGERLSDILLAYGFSQGKIKEIEQLKADRFNPHHIKANATYHVLLRKDLINAPAYLIYDSGPVDYYLIRLTGRAEIKKLSREVLLKRKEAKGTIESSLYHAFSKNQLNINLAIELSEIFAWTVDFYRIQKGDAFKVVYYEKYIEGKAAGIAYVEAASFTHHGKTYYAFRFIEDGQARFFDEHGQSVKKMFLKAPLKFTRISSRYNLKRFHPVLKTVKAHLGTDYAAPAGTPIMSVGDGTVMEMGYTSGNGNYIKIRHNAVYTTQYLHMSRFAKGIRKGKRVTQGEIIGYVGSTGLATGPHLCFRFWKNGKQVDPLREQPVQSRPVRKENLQAFLSLVDQLKPVLDSI